MGAFGTTMSQEEILSVVTFLRYEEKRRIAAGEIPDPQQRRMRRPISLSTEMLLDKQRPDSRPLFFSYIVRSQSAGSGASEAAVAALALGERLTGFSWT